MNSPFHIYLFIFFRWLSCRSIIVNGLVVATKARNCRWGLDTSVFRDEWVLRRSQFRPIKLGISVDIFRYGYSSGGCSVVEIDDKATSSTALETIVDIAAQIECDLSPTYIPLFSSGGDVPL